MASSTPQSSKDEHPTMDVERILHMKAGLGEASYAQNSSLQKKSMETLKHIVISSATEFYKSKSLQTLSIGDLGCSCGPNSLSTSRSIIQAICKSCHENSQPVPDFMVFLNDLPTNDFNTVFVSVPDFIEKLEDCTSSVFMAGVPGSFYGRLFPKSSMHFMSSWYSLHWLSQVPRGLFDKQGKAINKGKIYVSHRSPPAVVQSYFQQFQTDFGLFLKSRSEELTDGGIMAFAMLGRMSNDFDRCTTILWELLAQSFAFVVSQGLIEEEKVESYNVPFHAPSAREIKSEVEKEGSFAIDHLQAYELSTTTGSIEKDAMITSMAIRAIQESMITHHFGGGIIEPLFQKFKGLLCEEMVKEEIKSSHLIVVLRKLPQVEDL